MYGVFIADFEQLFVDPQKHTGEIKTCAYCVKYMIIKYTKELK